MKYLLSAILLFTITVAFMSKNTTQEVDIESIIEQMEDNFRGATNIAEIKMTINRPKWSREMVMKSWAVEDRLALIMVKSPARDKGSGFLKKDKEIWNWVPSIEKVVKLPPSMMMQSWMGSDFTNDDLVQSSSIKNDYTFALLGYEEIDGRNCYKIEMTPKPDAPVVWGKIITWISTENYLQLKSEFYDEDDYLINIMIGDNIKEMDGRIIPTRTTVTPVEEEGQNTVIEYISIDFDAEIDEAMFSVQNMKRMRID